MSFIAIEPQNNIAIVRLNNRVTNAINKELVDELADALKSVKQDFRGLVLAGGDKFFRIGLELPSLITAGRSGVATSLIYLIRQCLTFSFSRFLPSAPSKGTLSSPERH